MAKHYIIVSDDNGQPSQFPLKSWVRNNKVQYPTIDPDLHTTGHIRRYFVQQGWHLQRTNTEAFIVCPDANGSFDYATPLIEVILDDENEDIEASETAAEISFGLEKDLQTAIRKNITKLRPGLSIIDGGNEKNTVAGRIDITAKDSNGDIVVIELKAGIAKPDVIAQILSYITAMKNEGYKSVKGIIVANGFNDRVKLAAAALENIELVEYSFQFSFNTIK